MSLEDMINYIEYEKKSGNEVSWNQYAEISRHPQLTIEFFEKHIDIDWDYIYVLETLYGKCYKKSYFDERLSFA
jgi:hypothetical protein